VSTGEGKLENVNLVFDELISILKMCLDKAEEGDKSRIKKIYFHLWVRYVMSILVWIQRSHSLSLYNISNR